VETIVRAWRRVDRNEESVQESARHARRHLTLYREEDGSYVLRARLDPEVGALLERALDAASFELWRRDTATPPPRARAPDDDARVPQRRADAIGLVAERALRGTKEGANPQSAHTEEVTKVAQVTVGRADRFQVVLHVDADALRGDPASTSEVADPCNSVPAGTSLTSGHAVLAGGLRVSADTARRIACDASRVVMRHRADGSVLDIGRRTRIVPVAIRRALDQRDRGCRFPGCGNRFCDAHHIVHWADGGATRADNLVLLCRQHHRAVHEDGFMVRRIDDDGFEFVDPHGRPVPVVPTAPALPHDAVDAMMRAHRHDGIAIDANTTLPAWMGERLDLHYTISSLRR
jgi:5-methylcytosine-specific restriction endonuclease McrA